ncbi:hypothetical protein [Paenibacillus agricola]|uniref:hypothetical protein n=1 Tax=Paenibacillus agricola TaxID=2716264 RepID=UPI001FB74380|nr:hypothetical protein [Paenibacillus agricola]
MIRRIQATLVFPHLTVFSEENFRGASRIFRGNLGIRSTESILDGAESLRFFSTSQNATLVVFTRKNFKGNFIVYRGNRNLRDLDDLIRGNDVESLISFNQLYPEGSAAFDSGSGGFFFGTGSWSG